MDNQSPELFGQTPWQTVGPFFHYSLPWRGGSDLTGSMDKVDEQTQLLPAHDHLPVTPPRDLTGETIEIRGRVLDGNGEGVTDGLLELWQADAAGVYHQDACCFGRCATGPDGGFRFVTVRPGAVQGSADVLHAPHITLGVFARGVIKRLVTRMYFADSPENAADPALGLVPVHRRSTLVAELVGGAWCFDVVLQGEGETVFFRC